MADSFGRFHGAAVGDQCFFDGPIGFRYRQDRPDPLGEQFDNSFIRVGGKPVVEYAAQTENGQVVVAGFGDHSRKRVLLFMFDAAADHFLDAAMLFESCNGLFDPFAGGLLFFSRIR